MSEKAAGGTAGAAAEAAAAVRDHARTHLGWKTAVSYIDLDNARSIALARRLGAAVRESDFVARVDHMFTKEPLDDTEAAITAVLGVLEQHVSSGEIEQVKHAMRASIRDLWP